METTELDQLEMDELDWQELNHWLEPRIYVPELTESEDDGDVD